MKSLLLLILILSFGLYSPAQFLNNQIDAKHMKQGKWNSSYPNGKMKYEGYFKDDKPVGTWKRYHENGKIKAILIYRDNSDEVFAELYDPDGFLFSKGNFIGKDKDSTWTFYNQSKIVAKESYRKGVRNGKSDLYNSDGKILTETPWVNGKVNGVIRDYYPNGSLKSETVYRDGKRQGDCRVYFPNGITQIEGKYDNDLYDGEWTFYKDKDVVKLKMEYKKGVLQNSGKYDSLEMTEFRMLEQMRGKIKDPDQYRENPSELIRK